MVKGGGVDCATLLICAFRDAGLSFDRRLPPYSEAAKFMQAALAKKPLPYYAPQWHQHQISEKYLSILRYYFHEIAPPPLPGDVCLWKFGNTFSHAAIVVSWPTIVHARLRQPVEREDAMAAQWLARVGEAGPEYNLPRPMKILSYWGKEK